MKHQIVLVEWEDSRQPRPAWLRLSDLPTPDIVRCQSVGWLVYDGDDVKMLAPNLGDIGDPENAQASGVIQIPARCVVSVLTLRR